ncbi:MAG: BON domain-containing protein [Candidatus Competibacteraceae bacterium]|nr:BON domain-containing protein [Candidatus Competibacteraceae bacterium]
MGVTVLVDRALFRTMATFSNGLIRRNAAVWPMTMVMLNTLQSAYAILVMDFNFMLSKKVSIKVFLPIELTALKAMVLIPRFIAVWLWLSLVLVFCSESLAQDQPTEIAPGATVEVDNTGADDRAIERRLQEIFDNLDGLESVQITVDAGVVTLRGEVPSGKLASKPSVLPGGWKASSS